MPRYVLRVKRGNNGPTREAPLFRQVAFDAANDEAARREVPVKVGEFGRRFPTQDYRADKLEKIQVEEVKIQIKQTEQ